MNKITGKILLLSMFYISIVLWGGYSASNLYSDQNIRPETFTQLSVLLDENNQYELNSVLESDDWVPKSVHLDALSFGYSDTPHWIRLQVNDLPSGIRYLHVNYPLLDHITYYQLKNGQRLHHVDTGDAHIFTSRIINSNAFVFPITPVDGAFDVLLRVESSGTLKVPLFFSTTQNMVEKFQIESLLVGGYLGYMILMVMTCLSFIIITKNNDFLFYSVYITFITLLNLNLNGILFQWIWHDFPSVNRYANNLIAYGTGLFQLLFISHYLFKNVKKPILLTLMTFVGVMGFLLSFIPHWYSELSVVSAVYVLMVCILSVYYSAVTLVNNRQKIIRGDVFFLMGWVVILLGILTVNLGVAGWLPANPLVNNAAVVASILEIFFLTASMIDRYDSLRRARILSDIQLLKTAEQRQIMERHMLFQATHDSISNLPKKQILMQNWPQIKQEIPSDRVVYAVIIHLEGYYSLVLAFGQDVVDAIVHKLHCRIQEQICHHSQFAVIDFEWNKEKAVVLDSLDICLLYVCKEDETNINRTFDQYHRLLSEPYDYNGLSLDMNLTIGIQQVDLSEAISTSIRRAQVASKEASQRKINLLQYEHKTGHDPAYTSMLLAKFKQAIGTDAIFLVYQPQINVTTGSLFGVEALIRWKDDELGWISPCEFIPIIEQSSLINQLSEFVIYEACCFYSRYLSRFNAPIQLSINLSARNITDKNLIQFVSKTLDTLDVPAKCITFELTETAFLGDIATSRDMFNKLLDLGVNIALDDFGVGYSSLVYLKELPFSELKIDKGFLLNNSGTKQDVGFLKAAIQIGQSLDMLVIAEGVETLQMAQHLKQLGCELCQGYYFARPMTEVAFFEWCLDYKQQPNRIGLEHVDA